MILFLACLSIAALVIWVRGRLAEQDQRIAALTARLYELESRGAAPVAPPIARPVAPAPVMAPPPLPRPAPVVVPPPPPTVDAVAGPAPEPPSTDLESMIGGNWLSKLGVLMLLIGVALFLGFSLTEMGPLGRILTGAATSLALLGAGIAAERKDNYRVLGSALIGGGWAGLYFTAYAAHGIDASRVIEDPGVGLFLLLGVAAGMVLHSLRYRNQTITGLAYMAAFLTIAISSLTQYSAIASVPLLLSLLAVAWKFGWQPLAAAGALFAYGAYGFDLATGDKDRYFVLIGEPVLWTYWVILEGFDLAAKRRGARFPIAPLNLSGFLFATAAVWPHGSGWQPGMMLGAMAAAQLVSAALRGRWNEAREIEDDSVFGGFRASITYSSAFTAAFLIDHFTGLQRGLALALLAESVALAGWLFRNSYLRGLAAVLFAVTIGSSLTAERPLYWTLGSMFAINRLFLLGGPWYTAGAVITFGGLLTEFDPRHLRPALLTIAAAALGLALRWREKPEARWAGVALAVWSVCVLASQVPNELIAVSIGLPLVLYAAFGAALVEGPPRWVTFVLMQFYAGALLYRLLEHSPWLMPAWMGLALLCWALGGRFGAPSLAGSVWLPEGLALLYWGFDLLGKQRNLAPQLVAIALLFAMYLLPARGAFLHGAAASLVTTALLQDFVSGRRLTLAWSAEAITLLGAGIGLQRRQLRLSGLLLFAVCMGKLFFWDFSQLDTMSRILSFIVLGCLLIATSWAYSRFREQIHRYL